MCNLFRFFHLDKISPRDNGFPLDILRGNVKYNQLGIYIKQFKKTVPRIWYIIYTRTRTGDIFCYYRVHSNYLYKRNVMEELKIHII